ncbi:hypothetical protein BGZ98_003655 [Dissophora globulifera]|nr:hypothetical protein BGZ98_003655 [Dissophora globulifera]
MLDHLQQPLCPRFYKYDRQKLQLLEPRECTPIPSEHPDFSADVCFSPFMCNEGLVRVRRRDREQCKEANLRYPISGNATHDAFHRQFSGPDSFHVVFSGSEKLSPPDWYHAGQCLYVFPFHISNPGKLSLDITFLYNNFGAVVDQTDDWPELKRQKIISNLPLEICRGCPSRVAQPRFSISNDEGDDSVSTEFASSTKDDESAGSGTAPNMRNRYMEFSLARAKSSALTPDTINLPLCSRTMAVQGAWLPAHPQDKLSWRRANYTWTPLGCTYDKPLDKTCLRRRRNALKILFQGDTQLRAATEQLLRRLNGTEEIQTSLETRANRFEETSGSTTIVFKDDPFFTQAIGTSDVLVVNLGQSATGTKFLNNLWSTSQYHSRIRKLVDAIQQRTRDIQDLDDEDEDEDLPHHYPGGKYETHDVEGDDEADEVEEEEEEEVDDSGDERHYGDEDDDDEDELEMEREILRKEKENSGKEVYWDNEGDEKLETRPKTRLNFDRMRAEKERYKTQGRQGKISHDMEEPKRPQYPSNRFHRHSKQILKSSEPSRPRLAPLRSHTSPSGGRKDHQGHGYMVSSKKKAAVNGDKLSTHSDNNGITGSRRLKMGNIKSSKSLPTLSKGGNKSTGTKGKALTRKQPYRSTRSGNNNSNDGRSSNRMARRSFEDHVQRHHSNSLESPLKVMWAGMTAYPETQPVNPLFRHDWRTIYRLRYWNQIAENVMLLHNIPFMDFFSMTLSMLDTSPDRDHFYGTDAAEAMLEELAFKLGLCEDEHTNMFEKGGRHADR